MHQKYHGDKINFIALHRSEMQIIDSVILMFDLQIE